MQNLSIYLPNPGWAGTAEKQGDILSSSLPEASGISAELKPLRMEEAGDQVFPSAVRSRFCQVLTPQQASVSCSHTHIPIKP